MNPSAKVDDAGHDETALDPIKQDWHIFRGPPDYTHVSLPYIYETRWGPTEINTLDYTFRLTSPYDPRLGGSTTDLNPGAGKLTWFQPNTNAGDPREKYDYVQFWTYYASLYQYYSVMSVRYHITVENLTGERLYVHVMNFNQELPPPLASNNDMLLWKGVTSYMSTPHAMFYTNQVVNFGDFVGTQIEDEVDMTQATNPNTASTKYAVSRNQNTAVIQHSGQYNAGDFRREIALDDEVNTWTSTSANPTYPERLLIRIKHYDDQGIGTTSTNINNYDKDLQVVFKIRMEFLTEFKELKAGIRYPVARDPIQVVLNVDNSTS